MSQSFSGAEPKVVANKAKYKENSVVAATQEEEDDRNALNIMYDKRVFRGNTHNMNILKQNLTPSQKEDLRIKAERERKKVEMIKQQLIEFKKAKNKTSPYDLRPGPPARIEVDLTYFLTEQGKARAEEIEVKIQTDEFQPKPPTPPYIPKKTGIDKITQIEDYDLFDYDREVQPILNVLLTKTVEQAILEVEEETELDEIRKFKNECYKRKSNERDDWEQEVKKEIARIKQKNKALKNARLKREQQIKTMHKLQCLNIAKNFLSNTYINSMQYLADNNYWRNKFQDQLQVIYKEWIYKKIDEEFQKGMKSSVFQEGLIDNQFEDIGKAKEPIKKAIEFNIQRKEKVRQIESNTNRTVHYLFNPGVPSKITPFTRKYVKLLDGTLAEFENEERDKFQTYIEALENETLQDDEVNPVHYEDMPFFTCELTSLNRISFSVADDPFYKASRAKYYPELIVMNIKGKILTRVNPDNKKSEKYGLEFIEDFREPQLKINDDRKVRMILSQMKKPGRMILLTVRTNDLRRSPPKEGEFDRAWFRLVNEDTNQSIDYTKIKTIEKPDGFDEDAPIDEENAEEPKPYITYIAGRLFLDRNGRWVYESYNHCFVSDRFPNLIDALGDIYQRSEEEVKFYVEEVQRAKEKVAANEEDRRQQAKAAAAKKKGAKNLKKDQKEEEEEKKEEKPQVMVKKDLDLFIPKEFALAIQEKIPRPFIFGPIEFQGLNEPPASFPAWQWRQHIQDVLVKQPYMPENICLHGFQVTVKKRTLKRGSTIVKHSRFLRNLEVFPLFPPEPEPVHIVEEENQEQVEEDDD